MILDNRIEFLNDPQRLHALRKVKDQRGRKRIDKADLQNIYLVSEHLFHILIAGGIAYDPHIRCALLDTVQFNIPEGTCIAKFDQFSGALFHDGMPADRIGRRHQVFLRILLIEFSLFFDPLPLLHYALGVSDTGTHLDDDRGIILL